MKVALLVPGGIAKDPADGRIPCLEWFIARLALRHEVHVFSLHWHLERIVRRDGRPLPRSTADRYSFAGATVHEAGARFGRLRLFADLVAEDRRARFDVLHAFWVSPPGTIAAGAGALLRRPVLLHVAGGELTAIPDIRYGGLLTRRGRLWARASLAGASTITAASAQMVDLVRARRHNAVRVPLGVDLGTWPPVPPRPRRADAPARLIHVGDVNDVKDQRTLLRAAQALAGRGVTFELRIAGRDTLNGALEDHARRLGIADRVHFLGRVPHDRLHGLVAAADVLWLSSRHEAGPVAVLEAAVAGVPTVGTAVGHVAEWAPHAALAVPPQDALALAARTAELLQDDASRLALAHEAQRRALAEDADWTARRFESLYEDMGHRSQAERSRPISSPVRSISSR